MKYLFVFAHPDDETFATGGTIATLSGQGHTVHLLTATRGEKGQLGEPPLASEKTLSIVREQELKNAAKILGITEILLLDYIDGTLHQIKKQELIKKIFLHMQLEKPDVIVTFSKDGGSKHLDHIAISAATTKAVEQYKNTAQKPFRFYYTATPAHLIKKIEAAGIAHYPFGKVKGISKAHITTRVDIKNGIDKKLEAFTAHKTQHKDAQRFLKRKQFDEFYYEYFSLIYETSL